MSLSISPLHLVAGTATQVLFADSASPWSTAPTFTPTGISGVTVTGTTRISSGICTATVTVPAGTLGAITFTDSQTSRTTVAQAGLFLTSAQVVAAAAQADAAGQQTMAQELTRFAQMLAFIEAGTPPAMPASGTVVFNGVTLNYPGKNANLTDAQAAFLKSLQT